jgi:hypothetical protein
MRTTFATPLNSISEVFTFIAMAGLTVASAAAIAFPVLDSEPVVRLPTVVVTAKPSHSTEPVRLPTVVVVGKRSSSAS